MKLATRRAFLCQKQFLCHNISCPQEIFMSTNLVTTDSVRAVLGVSAKELPDTVLGSQVYSTRLREDLIDMHPQIISDFAAIGALASPTSDQQRFLDLMETYAAYNVAKQCLDALPMFSPLTIKDEKAELTRNVDSYKNLKADVSAVLSLMKGKLQKAYAAVNPDAPAPTPVDRIWGVSVGLGSDPVTATS
jgi:hypothetical protein